MEGGIAMQLKISGRDRELELFFAGELDHHAAREVMRALEEQVEERLPRTLVLDFGALQFMDSSGIAVVMRAHRLMGERGGSVRIRNPPAQAGKVLRAAAIDRLVPMT